VTHTTPPIGIFPQRRTKPGHPTRPAHIVPAARRIDYRPLLFTVFIHMGLGSAFRVIIGVDGVRPRRMSVVGRFFMISDS